MEFLRRHWKLAVSGIGFLLAAIGGVLKLLFFRRRPTTIGHVTAPTKEEYEAVKEGRENAKKGFDAWLDRSRSAYGGNGGVRAPKGKPSSKPR